MQIAFILQIAITDLLCAWASFAFQFSNLLSLRCEKDCGRSKWTTGDFNCVEFKKLLPHVHNCKINPRATQKVSWYEYFTKPIFYEVSILRSDSLFCEVRGRQLSKSPIQHLNLQLASRRLLLPVTLGTKVQYLGIAEAPVSGGQFPFVY